MNEFVKLWIRAQYSMHTFGYDLHPIGVDSQDRRHVIDTITWSMSEDNVIRNRPNPITIDEVAAQELMNDLWRMGVRPKKELYGDTDKTDIRAHLEDMRRIVSRNLQVDFGIPEEPTEKG